MEWNTNEKESDIKDGFARGEGDFALVKTRGCTDFAESSNKTMESTRRASDNECLDAVVERNAKLGIVGEIFVGCGDMAFQVLEIQPNDRKHRAGNALPALDRVGNDAWFEGDYRESDLRTRSSEEQPFESLLRVQNKLIVGGGSGDGDSRDYALRVTGCAGESFEHFTRCEVCNLERHEILDELSKPDYREGYSDGSQVRNGRARCRSRQP